MLEVKRVAAIHDLSCYGKASLTVVIPTLSAMGIEVCPLPTALLSTHTGIPGFTFLDLTAEMRNIIAHWKSLNLSFDAIYSGFLGSPEQVEVVSNFIDEFRRDDTLVMVDPVLGDDGVLYSTRNNKMVRRMRELIKKADVITPNLTELAFLSRNKYKKDVKQKEVWDWIKNICDESEVCGPQEVVVKSVPGEDSFEYMFFFNSKLWMGSFHKYRRLPGSFSGTGDAFASVLLGTMLTDGSVPHSAVAAADFLSLAIKSSLDAGSKELLLEGVLHALKK